MIRPLASTGLPLGILVEHLKTAVQLVEGNPSSVPPEIAHHLHKAWHLAAGLDPYVSECTSEESPARRALAQKTSGQTSNLLY